MPTTGDALRTLVTAVVYFAAAKLGLSVASIAAQVTLAWPPTGLALAAVLLFGYRVAPGIALGAFLANVTTGEPVSSAAGIAAGNTLEALLGAWWLRRVDVRPSLDRMRDVFALFACALGSTLISATIGAASLCLGGVQPWDRFAALWPDWWIGDAMGDLLVAPFLLVWCRVAHGPSRRGRLVEGLALLATTAGVTVLVFTAPKIVGVTVYPLHYAIFPIVMWGAMRFGQLGATIVTVVVSTLAIASTAAGLGPFASSTAHERLLLLECFLAVLGATGLLLGAAIAERDHAERQRAEDYAALELSADRLALALEAGTMGIWDWNLRTGEVHWTDHAERGDGLPGGFTGTLADFRALVHPDDRVRVDAAIQSAAAEGSGYDIEFRSVRPDGTVLWTAARGRVLRDADGVPVRMIGVVADITGRHRLEAKLRERAAALVDADRRKDEFLAMLSHELRNPLTPLSLALRLLRAEAPDHGRSIDIAERQVKHLVHLVDDLLDASRITRGKITLRRDLVPLDELMNRALEVSRPLIDARGHALRVSLPVDAARIEGDPVRLVQVFANLLDNAAKYTPERGTIWVTAEPVDGEVVVRVRDTGVGFDSDLVPRIFDLFVQGDTSLDRAHGGLGIGLTVVRRLVELHGGRVEARSAGAGKGSEFIVHLPAIRGAPGAAGLPLDPACRLRPLRILIVDDNDDVVETLATTLQLLGHEARTARDGLRALALCDGFAPEVVITDLGLPGMDGFELCRRLRQRSGPDRALLIALSGFGRDEDRARALAAGFDHHLVKPCELNQLLGVLASAAGAPGAPAPRVLH